MLKKNKSIALVMILALLIITSSCAPKNTQAEIDKPAKNKCLLGEETLQIKT